MARKVIEIEADVVSERPEIIKAILEAIDKMDECRINVRRTRQQQQQQTQQSQIKGKLGQLLIIDGFALSTGRSRDKHLHPPKPYFIILSSNAVTLLNSKRNPIKIWKRRCSVKGELKVEFNNNDIIVKGPSNVLSEAKFI